MKHKTIRSFVGAYLDGELHGRLKSLIEEHLKTCSECREELEVLKALNKRIKQEKLVFPADSYWDYLPERIIKRIEKKEVTGFLSFRLPRIKWELAGGVIILLLTFVVSRQLVIEKGREQLGHSMAIDKTEEKLPAADIPSSGLISGKKAEVVENRSTEKAKKGGEEVSGRTTMKEVMKKAAPLPKITEDRYFGKAYTEESTKSEGVSTPAESKSQMANEAVAASQNGKVSRGEIDEEDILSDIKAKEDYIGTSKDKEETQNVRRSLVKLLYTNANRTRKRVDVEKAFKEVQTYRDSYPQDYEDTLELYDDSLQLLIKEMEKEEKTSQERK